MWKIARFPGKQSLLAIQEVEFCSSKSHGKNYLFAPLIAASTKTDTTEKLVKTDTNGQGGQQERNRVGKIKPYLGGFAAGVGVFWCYNEYSKHVKQKGKNGIFSYLYNPKPPPPPPSIYSSCTRAASSVFWYGYSELGKTASVLQNLTSKGYTVEEKKSIFFQCLDKIGYVYSLMDIHGTCYRVISSVYSRFSKDLYNLIRHISDEKYLEKTLSILGLATVISVQLLIASFFSMPFYNQLWSLDFAMDIFDNEPELQQIKNASLDKIQQHLSINLRGVDWRPYVRAVDLVHSVYNLVTSYTE